MDDTFYQASAAMQESDLNKARRHLKSWQLITAACLVIILLQCIFIGYLLTSQNEYVYVARVKTGETIDNIEPLNSYATANETQKLAFIRNYITRLMTLSLDPVLVRDNWVQNYNVSGVDARQLLTRFIQRHHLVNEVGKKTQRVHIRTFNALSSNSYQFTWDVTTYLQSGNKEKTSAWSGVFTLSTLTRERSGLSELVNPFGLQVEYFSLNQLSG